LKIKGIVPEIGATSDIPKSVSINKQDTAFVVDHVTVVVPLGATDVGLAEIVRTGSEIEEPVEFLSTQVPLLKTFGAVHVIGIAGVIESKAIERL
jgi:hypothetical protein